MPSENVNNRAPILLIDSTRSINHSSLHRALVANGLANDISSVLPDLDRTIQRPILKKYSLIVRIVFNQCDTSFFFYDRSDSQRKRQFLAVDVGDTDQYERTMDEYRHHGFDCISTRGDTKSLAAMISKYFIDNVPMDVYAPADRQKDYSEIFLDTLQRLDDAADAIDAMRLNSTGEVVDELRRVSSNLRAKYLQISVGGSVERSDVGNALITILKALAVLFDVIENSKLAAIVVSGATTALIGGGGLTTTLNLTVMLAAWHGKEAFLAAIESISVSIQIFSKNGAKNEGLNLCPSQNR